MDSKIAKGRATGRLVEVQVKDGSVYSGVFYTASVDGGYGIVLKKARVIEKGKFYSNLNAGALLDTLVVFSNDLVQVVVKDFLLTRECSIEHYTCDCPWEGIDSSDLQNNDAASKKEDLSLNGSDNILEVRDVTKSPESLDCACAAFEGRPCAIYSDEAEKQCLLPVALAHVRDSEVHLQINSRKQTDTSTAVHHSYASFGCPLEENAIKENHDYFTSKDSRNQESSSPILPSPATKSTSNLSAEAPSSVAETSNPLTSSSSIDSNSALPLLSESSRFPAIKGNSFCNTYTKEFKLNPEAKVFVPSFMSPRSTAVNPPISSSEINSFPCFTPLSTKFVQYGPLVTGQSGIYPQFARPVMFGRAGQLFYVHALSQDPVQETTILSQEFPLLTPYLPKLEGDQSLPFSINLPVVTAPMHPYASSIPFPSPAPNVRSLTLPGRNGFVGNKFA
ncbi:hypothetical protein HPP92_027009 [Vanilla planifolia]|uniref:Ataxin 2 SM domain-containing protein n=1 Tax=Vanilla planifolia TaxID=51239 RepID=A0A835U697_VANPL|nr:hypothetical protein HPP92_027009 [Vanilla planifolia]